MKLIELNRTYSSKELSEIIGVSYGRFRNERERYEKHLLLFFDYRVIHKGNGVYYVFIEQYSDFITYREYSNTKRNNIIKNNIMNVINQDNRQTGSNIARIISINGEIQALNLALSTLTNYTRANLKEMIDNGDYIKEDYRWCYLDHCRNKYVLMDDDEVTELRKYFKQNENTEAEEAIFAQYQDRTISSDQAKSEIGSLRIQSYLRGVEIFYETHGVRPIKVPVYVRVQNFEGR